MPPTTDHQPPTGWNHNTHYHQRLLDALPRPCGRVLDVGCGRGVFTRRVAAVAAHVDAVDCDTPSLVHARANSTGFANIRYIDHDFLTWPGEGPYDAITMLASLHHLPFEPALTKAVGLLRPGGRLIVLGLDRAPSFAAGVRRALRGWPVSLYYRLTRPVAEVGAPIHEPEMTLPEIEQQTRALLSDAIVTPYVLWRCRLTWTKPAAADRADNFSLQRIV